MPSPPPLAGPSSFLRRYGGFLLLAFFIAIAALFLKFPPDDLIDSISGVQVRVIDGDSLVVSGEDIRLLGVDAPELHQTCRDARGQDWACGQEARTKMRALIGRAEVRCASQSHDRFGRALARCSTATIADLGEAMVREGYAVNDFDGGYAAAEAQARAARRGLWQGDFERPQDWRRRHPRTDR